MLCQGENKDSFGIVVGDKNRLLVAITEFKTMASEFKMIGSESPIEEMNFFFRVTFVR